MGYGTESNDKTPLFILIRLLKCENIGDLLFYVEPDHVKEKLLQAERAAKLHYKKLRYVLHVRDCSHIAYALACLFWLSAGT
jgi:hypothetical protein